MAPSSCTAVVLVAKERERGTQWTLQTCVVWGGKVWKSRRGPITSRRVFPKGLNLQNGDIRGSDTVRTRGLLGSPYVSGDCGTWPLIHSSVFWLMRLGSAECFSHDMGPFSEATLEPPEP